MLFSTSIFSVFDEFSLGHFDAIVMRFLTSLHFSRTLSRYCPAVFDEFAVLSDIFTLFLAVLYEFALILSDILTLFLAVFTSLLFFSRIF